MLLFEERSRSLKAGINLAASLALVATTIPFLHMAGSDGPQSVSLLGNCPAPFGIVLVLDNLSALMLALTRILALASLVFRSEEHTSELQSLMRISYPVFCLKKKP